MHNMHEHRMTNRETNHIYHIPYKRSNKTTTIDTKQHTAISIQHVTFAAPNSLKSFLLVQNAIPCRKCVGTKNNGNFGNKCGNYALHYSTVKLLGSTSQERK